MPTDKRLYMTFPNNFPDHPKILPLTDAAFRAFVEINGYSRTQDLDGRVPVKVARAKWPPEALEELETNHPERPTLSIEDGVYVIHNYAEHQETSESAEARRSKNAANGARGGRPKKPTETQSVTQSVSDSGTETEPNTKQSQSQSQSQSQRTDTTYLPEVSPVIDAREQGLDLGEVLTRRAKDAGVSDLGKLTLLLRSVVGPLSPSGALELAEALTSRSKDPVRRVHAYVERSCREDPDAVRWHYDRLDLAASA